MSFSMTFNNNISVDNFRNVTDKSSPHKSTKVGESSRFVEHSYIGPNTELVSLEAHNFTW